MSGAEEMRQCVRMFLKYGVDTIKLNLSGEYIAGLPAEFTPMTDEEIAMAVQEAQHARQARSPPTRAPASRSSSACATASS